MIKSTRYKAVGFDIFSTLEKIIARSCALLIVRKPSFYKGFGVSKTPSVIKSNLERSIFFQYSENYVTKSACNRPNTSAMVINLRHFTLEPGQDF